MIFFWKLKFQKKLWLYLLITKSGNINKMLGEPILLWLGSFIRLAQYIYHMNAPCTANNLPFLWRWQDFCFPLISLNQQTSTRSNFPFCWNPFYCLAHEPHPFVMLTRFVPLSNHISLNQQQSISWDLPCCWYPLYCQSVQTSSVSLLSEFTEPWKSPQMRMIGVGPPRWNLPGTIRLFLLLAG